MASMYQDGTPCREIAKKFGITRQTVHVALKSRDIESHRDRGIKTKSGFQEKHGMSATSTYHVWRGIKARCGNCRDKSYVRYGARGITYDARWEIFENFLADMGEKPHGMSLDRIDNRKGYSKENCRWATRKEQQNNTRTNVRISHNGETKTVAEWCETLGLGMNGRSRAYQRMGRGYTLFDDLFYPKHFYAKKRG